MKSEVSIQANPRDLCLRDSLATEYVQVTITGSLCVAPRLRLGQPESDRGSCSGNSTSETPTLLETLTGFNSVSLTHNHRVQCARNRSTARTLPDTGSWSVQGTSRPSDRFPGRHLSSRVYESSTRCHRTGRLRVGRDSPHDPPRVTIGASV